MKLRPYLSPLALLDIDPTKEIDSKVIRRHKKRLMAEFELEGAAEITLQGKAFDKSGLIQFFEELENPEVVSFHQYIADNPGLKAFLEEGNTAYFRLDSKDEKAVPSEFKPLLAPFFCYQYNRQLLRVVKAKDWEKVQELNAGELPVEIEHLSHCFRDTYKFIKVRSEGLEELAKKIKAGENPGPEVPDACDEMMVNVLNALPDHFEGLRNGYALALEELALAVYNQHHRAGLAKLILRQGLKLDLNQESQGRLTHVLKQLLEFEPDDEIMTEIRDTVSGWESKVRPWHIALAGVVLIKLIILMIN